jgi:16S rRNA (adenine1518-N6/adenine1519-N6)-dimethyltransferase
VNANELPTLRSQLEAHGLWADKGLGQHFLLDMNITRRIARAAGDVSGKEVLEVGPGPGGLTRALLEAGARVTAIEKDARFLPLLEPLKDWSGDRLHIVHGDALSLAPEDATRNPPCSIVSNLPYNVATPLLIGWLKASAWRGDMTLMFQKEVAQRIVATPGGKAYGRLAVLTQARCEARLLFTVPSRAFTPSPKVESAVVRLTDCADPFDDIEAIERVSAAAFGQRRKMLRSALKSLAPEPEQFLLAAEVASTARAEEIDQAGFRRLARAWRSLTPGEE